MRIDRQKVEQELQSRSKVPLGLWKGLAREAARPGNEDIMAYLLKKLDNDLWAYVNEDWGWFRRYRWAVE